jgi:hypothetical protein
VSNILLHPDDIGQWHFVIDVFSKVPLPSGTETRRPTTLTDPRKLEKTCALLALGIATALPVCAQLQSAVGQAAARATVSSATSGTSKLAFDAASVRPIAREFSLKGLDFLNPASDAAPPAGGLFSWNVQLPWLIDFAYDLRSSQSRREAREALPKIAG